MTSHATADVQALPKGKTVSQSAADITLEQMLRRRPRRLIYIVIGTLSAGSFIAYYVVKHQGTAKIAQAINAFLQGLGWQ